MKNKGHLWENMSVLCEAFAFAGFVLEVLVLLMGLLGGVYSMELFVCALVLFALAAVLDTCLANIDPERYNKGDF